MSISSFTIDPAQFEPETVAVLASWNDPAIAREEFIRHPDYEVARIATASALRLNWNDRPGERELLGRLLQDPSTAVAREAITTAGIIGHAESVPLLIEKLAARSLRRVARQTLLRMADIAVPQLIRRLADPEENVSVRRRIPKALALTSDRMRRMRLSCIFITWVTVWIIPS
jgi:HEAT repeat protein